MESSSNALPTKERSAFRSPVDRVAHPAGRSSCECANPCSRPATASQPPKLLPDKRQGFRTVRGVLTYGTCTEAVFGVLWGGGGGFFRARAAVMQHPAARGPRLTVPLDSGKVQASERRGHQMNMARGRPCSRSRARSCSRSHLRSSSYGCSH